MRSKIADLSMALEGRFGDHHAVLCRLHLDGLSSSRSTLLRRSERCDAYVEQFGDWQQGISDRS